MSDKEKFNQRNANRKALEMAAALVRDADFEQLFGGWGDDEYALQNHDDILSQAQANAVRRIEAMLP